jgi:hypothetical protein
MTGTRWKRPEAKASRCVRVRTLPSTVAMTPLPPMIAAWFARTCVMLKRRKHPAL